ncbi:PREDICTED: uncharacterized protein LOC101303391 [Fragaria vesca subsp. vesca]
MSEFSLQYVPQKAVKGQAIADFLAHHPPSELTAFRKLEFAAVALASWTLYFDGSWTDTAAGAGIAIENPAGDRFSYSLQLDFKCTNNQAEYELVEKFKCLSSSIEPYLRKAFEVLDQFDDVYIEHIPREFNFAAYELSQVASGLSLRHEVHERLLKVERRTLPSFIARGQFQTDTPEVAALDPIDEDWRLPFIAYLQNPNDATHCRQIRFLALNFVLRNGEFRRRGEDGNDFRCVYGNDAKRLMRESNGQAEASNKVILDILRKMLELTPRVWHEELYHTLWDYRTSKRGPTDTTPYALMYGHDVVLPLEINIASLRVQEQHQLLSEDYVQTMWQELEDLDEHRVITFNNLILEKQRIARLYDKVT